jgi:hypothetical protein
MSAFSGRRAPNVSQYIATLNTIPSAHDIASQQQEAFGLEDDLALFTNAQFFDFDMGENQTLVDCDPEHEIRARRENAAAHKHGSKGLDFLNGKRGILSAVSLYSCVIPSACPIVRWAFSVRVYLGASYRYFTRYTPCVWQF